MSRSVQYGLPMAIISVLTVSLSVVAMLVNSVVLAVPSLLLGRRPSRSAATCSAPRSATSPRARLLPRINTTLTETVEGARTVEALGLGEQRLAMAQADVEVSAQAERYGMTSANFRPLSSTSRSPRACSPCSSARGGMPAAG
ncbi:MAG: hypothetical protein R2734_07390 [Nocardioides sp.]